MKIKSGIVVFLIFLVFFIERALALDCPEVGENSPNIHRYDWVEHYAYWYPETNLSGYIFSFNNGTSWMNESWIESNASSWTNVTKQVDVNKDTIIEWMVYVNDTNNTWNVTPIRNYTIQNSLPIHSTPLLVSTDNPLNTSSVDLICYNQSTKDLDKDNIRNIYAWFKNEIPYENLILTFDTNSTIKDYSVYNNSGNLYGQPTWISEGKVGGTYIFDGVDEYVNIGDIDALEGDTSLTVSAWVYHKANEQKGIVAKDTNAQRPWFLASSITGQIYVRLRNAAGTPTDFFSVAGKIPLNRWVHVALVWDNTAKKIYLYADGIDAGGNSGSTWNNTLRIGTDVVQIGRYYSNSYIFNGAIDEVRIYSHALNPEQIKALYHLEYNKIVSQETRTNDVWTCSVTPNDGENDGINLNSTSITIQYVPPSIETKISPLLPNKTTDIKLNAICKSDSDIIFYWNWYKNGIKQDGLSGNIDSSSNKETEISNISNSTINKGEVWFAEVWCYDGIQNSPKINTTYTIVQDMPPSKPTLSDISPKDAYKTSKLSISASASIDMDNDKIEYLFKWNTSKITLSDWSTNNTLDCKFNENCKKGLTIYACARASVAYVTSPEVCKTIKIKNSPPTRPSTPKIQSKAYIDTVLVASEGLGSKDADNDNIIYYYEWRGSDDETILQPLSTARIFSCNYTENCDIGTTIHLHLKAYDGEEYSDYSLAGSCYIEENINVPIKESEIESESMGQVTGFEILSIENTALISLLFVILLVIFIFRKKIKKEKIYKIKQCLKLDSRIPISTALLFLIYCPILLIEGREVFANGIATYTYYFLVIGVFWQSIEYIKENRKKQKSLQPFLYDVDISDVKMFRGNDDE